MQGPNSGDHDPSEGSDGNDNNYEPGNGVPLNGNGNGYRNGNGNGHAKPPRDLESIRRGNTVQPSPSAAAGTTAREVELGPPPAVSELEREARPSRRSPSPFRVSALLLLFWLVSAAVDRFWLLLDNRMPAWDQADYLNGAMNYWALWNQVGGQAAERFSPDWWTQFWQLAPKIPPLTYLATLPFFQLWSPNGDTAMLVQLLFSAILLVSVYGLARCLFPRPVSSRVGLWAAAICMVLPGLARLRLEYLLDYPLAASVTFAWWMMTLWHGSRQGGGSLGGWFGAIATGVALALAILVKQTAALFLIIPLLWVFLTALFRFRWARLFQGALALLITGLMLRPWIAPNWLLILSSSKRATVDSAVKEGDPSLLSPDAWLYYLKQLPSQVSWPLLIAPLLGLLVYLLLRKRKPRKAATANVPYAFNRQKGLISEPIQARPALTLVWPLMFLLGAYLLASLNPNKDARYGLAYLPVLSLLLARGMTFYPPRLRWLPRGAIALSLLMLLVNLFPLPILSSRPQAQAALQKVSSTPTYPPAVGIQWPHGEIIQTMVQAEPYLQNTLGVLPSTPTINQHNISFFGAQQDFRVFGRQVGVREDQVPQDLRSLNWFLTKTGDQGSIPPSQPLITQQVETGGDFILTGQWPHPDGGELKLFHRKQPWITVEPSDSAKSQTNSQTNSQANSRSSAQVKLVDVELPRSAPPNQPLAVTYRWVGSIEALQNGVVALTWEPLEGVPNNSDEQSAAKQRLEAPSFVAQAPALDGETAAPRQVGASLSAVVPSPNAALTATDPPALEGGASNAVPATAALGALPSNRWFHDHTPGMGFLLAPAATEDNSEALVQAGKTVVQLQERLAMLPQAEPGQYQLTGQYIDRRNGEVAALQVPKVVLTLDVNAENNLTQAASAAELDWVTQLRQWSWLMPQGPDVFGPAFDEVARVNQYAPRQDYVAQAETSLRYRLEQPGLSDEKERSLRYSLVLAQVLQQDVDGAIAALEPLTALDGNNPYVYAYLSFVNLYGLRPRAAQAALTPALELAPDQDIVQILDGVGGLMSGNVLKAVRITRQLLSAS